MVTNNLLIRLKGRSAAGIEEAKKRLLSMDGKIPVLLQITVEADMRGPEKSGYDLMLMTRFNALEDLDVYLNHPVHLGVAEYIKTVMDASASLCYET